VTTLVLVVVGVLAGTWALARPASVGRAAGRTASPVTCAAKPSTVSIVIPARDEATTLPILLASLALSTYRPDEIVVVDDGSTDGTPAVARALGATVIAAGALPDGWAGKPWACSVGAAGTTGSILVFLDADVWLAPQALSKVVEVTERLGGLVSVQPAHHPVRFVEELSALFNLAAVMGSGAFSGPPRQHATVAFGPCLATRRDDYVHAGSHAAASGSVIEDVALARAFDRAGMPVHCFLGDRDIGFRMYAGGWRAIVEGWTKNIALGAGSSRPLPLAAVFAWVAALVAVTVDVGRAIVAWIGGATPPSTLALAYLLLATHLAWLLRRVGRFRWLTAALFPAPTVFFVAVFVRSGLAVASGRRVAWRGRTLPTRSANR
jgi:4,4'-diaponeurosporenoate glycosyltransferase